MKQNQIAFYCLTFSVFLFLIFPYLLSDGMFMDGVLYANVAKNLAVGAGSFWNLKLTETLYPIFQEHPPLAFGMQSIFYKTFGDSYLIERFYSLITYIITAYLILKIWELIAPREKELSWFPIFLWFTIPLTSWAVTNNMLENTLMIFTTLSSYCILKYFIYKNHFYLLTASFLLLLGVLTKGLVALFPLAIPFAIYVFNKKLKIHKLIITSSLLIFYLLAAFILLFLLFPESYDSLLAYFNNQIVGSLQNIQTVESRFFIVVRLIKELIPIFVICFILQIIRYKKFKSKLNLDSWFFIMIGIGLTGVIPIMVSMKQSGFYMLAAFPFFALGFAYLIKNKLQLMLSQIKSYKGFTIISILILGISIVLNLLQIGKIGRDEEKLKDIYSVIEIVSKNSIIGISADLRSDWAMNGYFYRYGNISLDSKNKLQYTYYFSTKDSFIDSTNQYKLISTYGERYELYKKK